MPDVTKISAAELNIERKINARAAHLIALTRADGIAGFRPLGGFGIGDGVIKRSWAPFDYNDGVHLRIKIAEIKDLTSDVLKSIDAFAYWRDLKKDPGTAWVYIVTEVEYPEIFSKREWTFACTKLEEYVPVAFTIAGFNYIFDIDTGGYVLAG